MVWVHQQALIIMTDLTLGPPLHAPSVHFSRSSASAYAVSLWCAWAILYVYISSPVSCLDLGPFWLTCLESCLQPVLLLWTGFTTFPCLGLLIDPVIRILLWWDTWDLNHASAAATCSSRLILPCAVALLVLLRDMGNICFPFCRNSR